MVPFFEIEHIILSKDRLLVALGRKHRRRIVAAFFFIALIYGEDASSDDLLDRGHMATLGVVPYVPLEDLYVNLSL